MAAPKICISGYYGFGNAGDEAILAAMLGSISRQIPQATFCVFSDNPSHTSEQFGVRSVDRKSPFHMARELWGASVLLSGGGGLIQDSTGINTIRYYLSIVSLARFLRRPVMFYAQGVGPVATDAGKQLTQRIANTVQLITVRDEESAQLFRDMGVSKPPLWVTADPVLALQPAAPARVDEILRSENLPAARPMVGLSIRPWPEGPDTVEAFAAAGRHLRDKHGVAVVVLPFQESQDRQICNEVAARIGDGCHILRAVYSPAEFMGVLGRLRGVLAMRLHALIFGAAQGVPVAGVAYDPKVANFLRRVEAPTLPLPQLSAEALMALADRLLAEHDGLAGTLSRCMPPLREQAEQTAVLLDRLLRGEDLHSGVPVSLNSHAAR
jgi:polysaccharide pyruvyl transferase CsaB